MGTVQNAYACRKWLYDRARIDHNRSFECWDSNEFKKRIYFLDYQTLFTAFYTFITHSYIHDNVTMPYVNNHKSPPQHSYCSYKEI
mgnify:CR=1 FL=1